MSGEHQSRPGWAAERLAEAANETPQHLAWYADAGMLHTEAPGVFAADSLHRLRLIHHAHRRGVSDEDLAMAVRRQGDLLSVFEELGAETFTDQTMQEAARAVDLPPRLRDELIDLLGLEPNDYASTDDTNALQLLQSALELGLPEDALIQLIRVYVDATGRIADAETRIFHDHVHDQFRAQGLQGKELLAATESVGKPALTLTEPALLYFHRRAFHRANRDDLLRHLAEATTPPGAVPGETTGTVVFVDLAGFTPLTVTLGDSGVAEVLQRFASTVRREADTHAGRIIKQIGDAFMLVFDRPGDAVVFGISVMRLCGEDGDLPPLHIGAHHGPLLYRDGDYFGNTVNLAARVTSASDAGQFLVTDAVSTRTEQLPVQLHPTPPRALKGVTDAPPLLAVEAK